MHTKESVREKIDRDDRAVCVAMVWLYQRQTADEKQTSTTKHTNGMGFTGFDAPHGSYYAKYVLSGKWLTGKHLARARRMAYKYAGQLAEEANLREAQKDAGSSVIGTHAM